MKPDEVKKIIEVMIFASSKPVSPTDIGNVLELKEDMARGLVQDIAEEFEKTRAIRIREVAGGYEMYSEPKYSKYVQALKIPPKPPILTGASLETLSIIAYKQPITKGEIEKIRGVNVESVIKTLLERDLIEEAGRKEGLGRPILYGTTKEFLRYFGLKGLHELPEVYEIFNEEE